ncbi:HTH-type transcriptional regulator TrpI [Bradyrhizobium ivorense]|uniref:HTH-type transcriptional regulator TrpI n=1 Tax=Bradyrhizobium ivorense TaxID=2511166 RepID=A0A508TEM5_9BRAD|nr:LysR substrate-binding domain-containing protein [Bradyrhizobium ivorense]VIO71478.1 HTH-type transcriptional regulator TrpI [Bradyrhizobium ivorense]
MKLRDLPLVSLRTFAVVAESDGIGTAADALGVTHSAVSKQIKLLERWLGQALFSLEGRRLVLTPFGVALSREVGRALEDIAGACAYVQRQRERRTITVEAPATFAMYWLLPRVNHYRAQNPRTDVWVSTRMTGQSPNFSAHDLVVTRGEAVATPSRLNERVLLFREDMAVLTSPKLLACKPLVKAADVKSHHLIESMTRPHDWPAWLKRAGVSDAFVAGGHRFDHLFVAIQAVKDGLGSLVAPQNVLQEAIARLDLASPFPELKFSGESYFCYCAASNIDPATRSFRDWLVQEATAQGTDGSATRSHGRRSLSATSKPKRKRS